MKLSDTKQRRWQMSLIGRRNRAINVESTDRNLFTRLSKMWLSLHRFSWNLQSLNQIFVKPTVAQSDFRETYSRSIRFFWNLQSLNRIFLKPTVAQSDFRETYSRSIRFSWNLQSLKPIFVKLQSLNQIFVDTSCADIFLESNEQCRIYGRNSCALDFAVSMFLYLPASQRFYVELSCPNFNMSVKKKYGKSGVKGHFAR